MPGDPFREQRLDPKKVRWIVKKAAALADRDGAEGRALTLDEVQRAAAELGIPADAIEAAARATDDDDAEPGAARSKANWFIGAPTRLHLEEILPGEPSEEDCEDMLDEIHEVLGMGGTVERVGKTLAWNISPGYRGRGRSVSIRIRSRDGQTKLSMDESLQNPATGLFLGIGLGAGIGPMGGYIAAIVKLGLIGLAFPILWIPLMLILARTIYGALARRRERALEELMARLTRRARTWSGPKLRVAAETASASDAEAEAAAEEEAATGSSGTARRTSDRRP